MPEFYACQFKHEGIDVLHGVAAQPVQDLPKTCTCGRPLTYADEVAFVTYAGTYFGPEIEYETLVDGKWATAVERPY